MSTLVSKCQSLNRLILYRLFGYVLNSQNIAVWARIKIGYRKEIRVLISARQRSITKLAHL